jgi:hypothetical protein
MRRRHAILAAATLALPLLGAVPASAGTPRAANPNGAFVIGDLSARSGAHVEFWGAQWAKENRLSGGAAPNAFKGWAENVDLTSCSAWTSDPGNSAPPPATVGSDITVLVATTVDKSGPVISGDAITVATVHVDAGYEGNPGHEGTGTVTGVYTLSCGGGNGGGGSYGNL